MGLFDRKVQLNLSGFFYDYKDKQIFGRAPDLVFGTLFRILNVPRSEVYGAEADLTFRPLPYLNINLAAVYLHSRILEYSGFNDAAMFTNFRGHPFTLTPNFQGNALITLSPPITDDINLDASVSAHYQSRSTAAPDEAPDFRINSYAVFGGTLGVRSADDRFSVGLYAQNIFNKYYWTQVLSATDSIYRFSGGPRQFGLRLGYRY
jgi:outer membrane receptor protein involved in Fe transport